MWSAVVLTCYLIVGACIGLVAADEVDKELEEVLPFVSEKEKPLTITMVAMCIMMFWFPSMIKQFILNKRGGK